MSHRVDFLTGKYAAQDNRFPFTLRQDDGSPEDLTGWSFEFTVRENPTGPVIVRKTSSSGITVTSLAGGLVDVVTLAADTSGLMTDREMYYMLRRSDSGNTRVLAEGIIIFNSSMAR